LTSDQILRVPVSSASGYRNQWRNAGELSGYTHEVALGAVLLSKKDFFWRMNVVGDRTRQTITDLNVGPFLVGPDDGDAGAHLPRAKGKFGVIARAGSRASSSDDAGGRRTDRERGNYLKNEEASMCGVAAPHPERVPLKYVREDGTTLMEIGDVNPGLGFGSNVQWRCSASAPSSAG
jgi:hypothetical protein